jgi:hypothetical protein
MDPKSGKSLRVFVNPFASWTDLALKTGEAMLASAHAAAVRANASKVAVIPPADVSPSKAEAPAAAPPIPAAKPAQQASKAARSGEARSKVRSKAKRRLSATQKNASMAHSKRKK